MRFAAEVVTQLGYREQAHVMSTGACAISLRQVQATACPKLSMQPTSSCPMGICAWCCRLVVQPGRHTQCRTATWLCTAALPLSLGSVGIILHGCYLIRQHACHHASVPGGHLSACLMYAVAAQIWGGIQAFRRARPALVFVTSAGVERNALIGDDEAARKADIPIVQVQTGPVFGVSSLFKCVHAKGSV